MSTFRAVTASVPPTLIVPQGRAPARPPPPQPAPAPGGGRLLTKTQVLGLAQQSRPLAVAFPWATLSANKTYVSGRAELTIWNAFAISCGSFSEIKLSSGAFGAGADAQVWVRLPSITPGQLFLVEVIGWCGGPNGALRFETKTGSADAPITQTNYNLPVAVTDPDGDALLVIKIKALPRDGLSIKTIKVWKLD